MNCLNSWNKWMPRSCEITYTKLWKFDQLVNVEPCRTSQLLGSANFSITPSHIMIILHNQGWPTDTHGSYICTNGFSQFATIHSHWLGTISKCLTCTSDTMELPIMQHSESLCRKYCWLLIAEQNTILITCNIFRTMHVSCTHGVTFRWVAQGLRPGTSKFGPGTSQIWPATSEMRLTTYYVRPGTEFRRPDM